MKDCACGSKLFLVKVAKKDGHGVIVCRKCGQTQRVAVSAILGRHRPEKSLCEKNH